VFGTNDIVCNFLSNIVDLDLIDIVYIIDLGTFLVLRGCLSIWGRYGAGLNVILFNRGKCMFRGMVHLIWICLLRIILCLKCD
jgi:hypothetical protein